MFLATPHHGSDKDLERLLESRHWGKESYRGEYMADVQLMGHINRRFEEVCQNFQLSSLCETQPVRISGKKIVLVEERNARLGSLHEHFYRLDANHDNMCKYESPGSVNYFKMYDALATLLSDAMGKPRAELFTAAYGSALLKP
jgi:hypothetical protein